MSKTHGDIGTKHIPHTAAWLRYAIALLVVIDSTVIAKTITHSDSETALRNVRVLIGRNVEKFNIRSASSLTFENTHGKILHQTRPNRWVNIFITNGKINIADVTKGTNEFIVRSSHGTSIELSRYENSGWTDASSYLGSFRCFLSSEKRIHIVNNVEVETYVAGVVAREVWPTFADQAYRAQAIAARSFVLCQMKRRQSKAWDVTDGQRSQVYAGLREDRTGRRASQATKFTEGIVCIYDNGKQSQIVRTYYSAACGGMTQSAAIFGPEDDIPPLAGGVACDYCRIAPGNTYRWKPLRLTKREIYARITARNSSLKSLGKLRNVSIVKRSAQGRPVTIRLYGNNSQHEDMLVEQFRLSLDGHQLRSSDFRMRVVGDIVTFDHGRGYGHGLGLCQWGMEGQAREGKSAAQILRYYFPGSRLQRAY